MGELHGEVDRGELSLDLSCQTFGPMAKLLCAISKVDGRAAPIGGAESSEALPPDFNRLKCKPDSSAFRKQIENFVPLVPYRTRRFSWARFWTVDTLDAEQDPRRRQEPDTVFFICGFNTMGEFHVESFFFFFFSFPLDRDAASSPGTSWGNRASN